MFAVTCPSLSLSNGGISYNKSPVNGRYPVETVASLSCHHGYSISGSNSRTCQTSGNWDQQTVTCNQSNQNKLYITLNYAARIVFKLTRDFFLQAIMYQEYSGQVLNIQIPKYIFVVTCPALNLVNGQISYDASPVNGRFPVGTTASLSCDAGYSLSGTRTRTCHDLGNWDNQDQTPTCNAGNENVQRYRND